MTQPTQLNIPTVSHYMLFGAGLLLIETAKILAEKGLKVSIFTAPRQLDDVLTDDGETFLTLLQNSQLSYLSVEDINTCDDFIDKITDTTLGLGFGEAWSFSPTIIDMFAGRLLDYMGIPLPQYRGGAHYTWALLNQQRTWGCHFQVINEEMVQGEFDSGELVFSDTYEIPATVITPYDFFQHAVQEEIKFVTRFIDQLEQQKPFTLSLPDESNSLFFPRLHTLKNGWIDWRWRGAEIERFINAFSAPYAGASTRLDGNIVQIKGCTRVATKPFHPFESGLITRLYNNKAYVLVDDGMLEIDTLNRGDTNIIDTLKLGQRLFSTTADLETSMLDQVVYSAAGVDDSAIPVAANQFQSERLNYRPLTIEDCNAEYLSWLNDTRINQYLETRWSEQSVASIKAFVDAINGDETSHLFGMFAKDTGKHIGNIKIGPINPRHQYADISYFIGCPTYWGQGLATEAIRRVTAYGFEELDLHTIQAGVYSGNIGSIKALEKCGYTKQAQIKEQLLGPNGREDHLWYSRGK